MKFIVALKDGSFLGEQGPTNFASMAALYHCEAVAQVIALGLVGAKVVPLKTLGTYQHEPLRESEYFRHLEHQHEGQ